MQHIAAFKAHVELVQDAMRQARCTQNLDTDSVAQPVHSDSATVTAANHVAAEEEWFRAVVDLREAANKLANHKFQEKAKPMDCVDNNALFVPSGKAMSMFSPVACTQCLPGFWYGDCLPSMATPQPKLNFEKLFKALLDREELEHQLDSDSTSYRAKSQSRFDTTKHSIVLGDTLKRLHLFKGSCMALKCNGFQRDVKLIPNATSEQCMSALQDSPRQPGDVASCNAEALAEHALIVQELRSALRQVLISTEAVPLTDGYKINVRDESHNLNVTEGPLVVSATFNYADTYSRVLSHLVRDGLRSGGA